MADTKQTKTIGEHAVAAELARHGWAPAMTRDGLERTDILAVEQSGNRTMVEVQVKAARGRGPKLPLRFFIVPRDHVAAAAWIEHMNWLTEPGIIPGLRNVGPERSRVTLPTFAGYENAWSTLAQPTDAAPIMLPPKFRDYAQDTARVGLPPGHAWRKALPSW
jgi:hypothetical protein